MFLGLRSSYYRHPSTLRVEISSVPKENIFREDKRDLCSQGTQRTNIFFCVTTYLYSESTRVDISNIFALLVFEDRRLQRSFEKLSSEICLNRI